MPKQIRWWELVGTARKYHIPYISLYKHLVNGQKQLIFMKGNLYGKSNDIETYLWNRAKREKSGINDKYRKCVERVNQARISKQSEQQ